MNIADLVVTLGLNAAGYRKEAADVRNDQGKVVEQSDKMAKRLESDGKRAAQSFRNVRNEVAGLLLAFTGAASIGTFAKSILTNDAAVGRLATNLGVATGELSKWEAMVQRVGGQAGDADGSFRALKRIFTDKGLTGDQSKNGDLMGLGITSLAQLNNPAEALLKIAETGDAMRQMPNGQAYFAARLERLGVSDSMITLLSKGREEVARMLVEQEKLGHATDESSEAAKKFEDRLNTLRTMLIGAVRPGLTEIIGLLTDMGTAFLNAQTPLDGLLGSLAKLGEGLGVFGAFRRITEHLEKAGVHLQKGEIPSYLREMKAAFNEPLVPNVSGYMGGNQSSGRAAAGGGGRAVRGANGSIIAYLERAGFSHEQARGIDAGIGAEGGHATARNPTSGAFGIGQWLGSRKRGLMSRYGPNPTKEEQMAYLVWELNGGDHGGRAVRNQTTASGTLNAYITRFMRPAAGRETTGDLSRGMSILGGRPPVGSMARRGGGSSTNTTSIGQVTIITQAKDADGIARDLPRRLAEQGLVVQSATGMTS